MDALLTLEVFLQFAQNGESLSEIEFLAFCKSLKIYPVSLRLYQLDLDSCATGNCEKDCPSQSRVLELCWTEGA